MKLQTLNYIHELLIENEKKAQDAKSAAWSALKQANKNESDYNKLLEKSDYTREEWIKARTVLNEFEKQDWR